ncbi:hypothetical protein PP940_gp227 [Rhizobium phage RL2RES]|uniref:Uncharacterized protein n=1 Tax=Rhizobium phage RL2RES TaxID=103371 RepID=A0A6B9J3W6_9CAUD|nr:hypothetical protein PP940_gp227 [Rhizobium phage RL2RES]QGZ14332.1 hypothetical protein RL2RES_227 [Rhizobium phage RL2RES]
MRNREFIVLKIASNIINVFDGELVATFHNEDLYQRFVQNMLLASHCDYSFWVENEARYEQIQDLTTNDY